MFNARICENIEKHTYSIKRWFVNLAQRTSEGARLCATEPQCVTSILAYDELDVLNVGGISSEFVDCCSEYLNLTQRIA